MRDDVLKMVPAVFLITLIFGACSTNNVTIDDSLGQLFDSAGVKGDFGLFDNGQGSFTIYDLPRFRDSLYPAGETFDLLQALIAFQTGVLKDDKAVLVVKDTVTVHTVSHAQEKSSPVDVTVGEAFRVTGVENFVTFQKLANQIGIDSLKKWVDSLKYGDKNIRVDSGQVRIRDIRINSDQELGLVKKLYFDQLPFFRRSQQLVRDMMTKEANSNYMLVYKTGRAFPVRGGAIGWVMGWVEENKHPYFFVVNVESSDGHADVENIGIQLAKHILSRLGFFRGKK
jgi:beta-lactamase class D